MQNALHPKKEATAEEILLLCENTQAGSELLLRSSQLQRVK